MSVWAIVPVKPLNAAKSRLGTLSQDARRELMLQWLEHTLAELAKMDELSAVLVVSADEVVLSLATMHGARTLHEATARGLNEGISLAIDHSSQQGASRVLILPADLPNLCAEDVRRLLAAHTAPRALTISPDRHEQGTNALALSPPNLIAPMFGEGSLEKHVQAGAAAGAVVTQIHLPRLMLDVDTPDDLKLMEREAVLFGRRSIRRYAVGSVPQASIERVLHAATWAPSAHNRQPWRFAVLRDASIKQHLADAMGSRLRSDRACDGDDPRIIEADALRSRVRITEAPVVIIVAMSMADMDMYHDAKRNSAERAMATQSVAMAVQNLLLAAHNENLGACWMCAPLFCADLVRDTLSLPADWEPQALVTLGYPANEGKPASRKALDAMTLWR